jgi:hypothetical protein
MVERIFLYNLYADDVTGSANAWLGLLGWSLNTALRLVRRAGVATSRCCVEFL